MATHTEAQLTQVPEGLQGIIITDCSDPNAEARQKIRFASLFGTMPTFIKAGAVNSDLEAAGHLVECLGCYPDTGHLS